MIEQRDVGPDEAHKALNAVEEMQRAGFRRALPPRWFGVGVSLIVASLFALYALEDPYKYTLFPILALAIFVSAGRENIGAYEKDFPSTGAGWWALAGVSVFFIVLFFGGIGVRRAYGIVWAPLVTGLIAAIAIFLLNESHRRHRLAKTGEGARE